MLNTSRQVEQMIFQLDTNAIFGNVVIKSGMNTVTRIDSQYQIKHVSNMYESYAVLPDKEMPKLLNLLYAPMIEPHFSQEEYLAQEITKTKPKFK